MVAEKADVLWLAAGARKCRAHTSGLHGANGRAETGYFKAAHRMPVSRGKAPQVKVRSTEALQRWLDPGPVELNSLIHQNEHLPSKLAHLQCDEPDTTQGR